MMTEWKYILIDLDGTITDSRLGITNCVKYVLDALRLPVPSEQELLKFIGPPLVIGFQENMGMTPQEAVWATDKYRERYNTIGLFEAEIYPGIDQVLAMLKRQGRTVSLATSKPEETAVRILELFGLLSYFDETTGATMDGTRDKKEDVIREALRRLEISEADKKQVLMIGDRKHDMIGARACGIASLGVYYGFAEPGELEEAGADYVVQNMEELKQFFDIND